MTRIIENIIEWQKCKKITKIDDVELKNVILNSKFESHNYITQDLQREIIFRADLDWDEFLILINILDHLRIIPNQAYIFFDDNPQFTKNTVEISATDYRIFESLQNIYMLDIDKNKFDIAQYIVNFCQNIPIDNLNFCLTDELQLIYRNRNYLTPSQSNLNNINIATHFQQSL